MDPLKPDNAAAVVSRHLPRHPALRLHTSHDLGHGGKADAFHGGQLAHAAGAPVQQPTQHGALGEAE
jgi:hypothetical protein